MKETEKKEQGNTEKKNPAGHFQGFVLLDSPEIDMDSILKTLKEEWGIIPEDEDGGDGGCGCQDHHGHDGQCRCGCGHEAHEAEGHEDDAHKAEGHGDDAHEAEAHGHGEHELEGHGHGGDCCCCGDEAPEEGTKVFMVGDSMAAISLMPAPIPGEEAEFYAQTNYMWPEAVSVTRTHKAHILVAVMPMETPAVEAGKLYSKLIAACLKEKNAIGVYTSGTVFQPEFYLEVADAMKEDEEELPILVWVYFGLYRTDKGNSAYTYGLAAFGRDEIEILNSQKPLEELRDFLYQITSYVIGYDVTLQDGETIGFSEDERLPISRSAAAALEGDTLKIAF